ncbi:TadE/TadG family type IV pilus assembly protein [Pseudomonas resinovorans]|uniref:TadE/TadG family type IV pilus assembly protein n=1 Tax=Metapseudomonas resinovorans TaxID=53412 RepID=UPI00237F6AFE|nr:TadE/TadG family type IV pilus assembly protein [Pseudomonas resinovorans]MDE3739679.1 TadE/TadG family type IV pilus assembly protein [Pseudomonas resinovorans]
MVEFAITLPLLLIALLAIGEFGRMLFQYNSLLQASRDAGRYVAGKAWDRTLGKIVLVDTQQDKDLVSETQNIAVYGIPGVPDDSEPVVAGLGTGDVTVSVYDAEHVQVSISFTFQPLIGDGIPALLGDEIDLNLTLVATTVMRAL